MPKRKWTLPPLEELLEHVFCYYCERTFVDYKSLQEHMKVKHLRCTQCNKKMDSLGGLKVHFESVHKMPLDKVQNARSDRESADGPEIYLMEGVPQELVQAFRERIISEYQKAEYEYRMETGNPVPGSKEAMERSKKIKIEDKETPEERAAKRKAHVEKRRAEIAAKKAAKERGEDVKDEPNDDFTSQEPHIKLEQNEQKPYTSQSFNGYQPGYATASPMGGMPMSQPPSQAWEGFGHPQGPPFGHSPTNYGQPYPFQPNFPDHTYPQQHAGYGYGGSPQGFPPQPMTGRSSFSHQSPVIKNEPGITIKTEPSVGTNGKTIMATAPSGLPARPTFDTPSYSREDMQKLHAGQNLPPPAPRSAAAPAVDTSNSGHAGQTASVSTSPPAAFAEPVLMTSNSGTDDFYKDAPYTSDNFARNIDDLLSGGHSDMKTEPEVPVAAAAAATVEPKTKKTDVTTSKDKKTVFKADVNGTMSPEEKKSKLSKYQKTDGSKKKTRRGEGSVIEQADSQAVTGRVADDMEQ